MYRLRLDLSHFIEPDMRLLTVMCRGGILTHDQFDDIDGQPNVNNKTLKLLHYILNCYNGDIVNVLNALEESDQKHIVNFIKSGGGKYSMC